MGVEAVVLALEVVTVLIEQHSGSVLLLAIIVQLVGLALLRVLEVCWSRWVQAVSLLAYI